MGSGSPRAVKRFHPIPIPHVFDGFAGAVSHSDRRSLADTELILRPLVLVLTPLLVQIPEAQRRPVGERPLMPLLIPPGVGVRQHRPRQRNQRLGLVEVLVRPPQQQGRIVRHRHELQRRHHQRDRLPATGGTAVKDLLGRVGQEDELPGARPFPDAGDGAVEVGVVSYGCLVEPLRPFGVWRIPRTHRRTSILR